MSKYFVVKIIDGRFRYYFQGLDKYSKPQWTGLTHNALRYSQLNASTVQDRLMEETPFDNYEIQLYHKN